MFHQAFSTHRIFASVLFGFLFCLSSAQIPDWTWAKRANGSGDDIAYCVAAGASGNIYVAGSYTGDSIIFGTTVLDNPGAFYSEMFLVKYDPDGDVIWAKKATGNFDNEAYAIAVDENENILLTGIFNSTTVTFDSITLVNTGGISMFVVKYDSDGNVIWAKQSDSSQNVQANSISTDPADNIYITGYFSGYNATFAPITLSNQDSSHSSIFIVKYDPSGNVIWAKSEGGTNNDGASSIKADESGHFYICGYFQSDTLNFGAAQIIKNPYGPDLFLVKYDTAGNAIWAKSGGGPIADFANGINVDDFGNVYVTGYAMSDTSKYDSITLISTYGIDMVILKYNAAGSIQWAKEVGANYDVFGTAVVVDPFNDIYVAGYFMSPVLAVDSFILMNEGSFDIFVVKYDSSGNTLWAKSAGGTDMDMAKAIAADDDGNIYVSGLFKSESMFFETETLLNTTATVGYLDMFVSKLDYIPVAGNDEAKYFDGLKVFPNPSEGKFTLLNQNETRDCAIEIYNVTGEVVYESNLHSLEGVEIDISDQPDGVYFLSVVSEKGRRSFRVLKI